MAFIVAHEAPDFEASAVLPDGSIDDGFKLKDLRGQYTILLFYPMDFTFVCPTEILSFDENIDKFSDRECAVVGISVDSPFTHQAWHCSGRGLTVGPLELALTHPPEPLVRHLA